MCCRYLLCITNDSWVNSLQSHFSRGAMLHPHLPQLQRRERGKFSKITEYRKLARVERKRLAAHLHSEPHPRMRLILVMATLVMEAPSRSRCAYPHCRIRGSCAVFSQGKALCQ